MRFITNVGIILLVLNSGLAVARDRTTWDVKLESIANKEGIPAPLLQAICWVESSHRPHVTNWDDNGSASVGLCQLKLATAQWMGFTGDFNALYKGETNARWAARFIKFQLKRYNDDWYKTIAAYNAGTAIFSKKNPGKLINEGYVDKVLKAVLK